MQDVQTDSDLFADLPLSEQTLKGMRQLAKYLL